MHNIDYDYAKRAMHEREAGMRRAQLDGTSFEYRPKHRLSWPWVRSARSTANGSTRVAPAAN